MIKFNVTGDLRSIANAAWISTMDQSKAEQRSEEDVDRVTSFLAENAHSSPFEAVTISFVIDTEEYKDTFRRFKATRYYNHAKIFCVDDRQVLITTDLLNFYKINYEMGLDSNIIWDNFSVEHKVLASKIKLLPLEGKSSLKMEQDAEDQHDNFKNSNIEVDLVSVHAPEFAESHTRITWRVKCPLSIGVQMLRHRTASFNMVSGRYKTIRQEFTTISEDLIKISEKADLYFDLKDLRGLAEESKSFYLSFMKKLAYLKRNSNISNEEYKRFREFVRFILPEGRMTELYVTFYKKDFDHFLRLRNSSHTQPEHIYVAQLMKKTYEDYLK